MIWNIINNAYDVFEEESKRKHVRSVVKGAIDFAADTIDREEQVKKQKSQVRKYVFSLIEDASQVLEKERIEEQKIARQKEQTIVAERERQMNKAAQDLVSASIAYAKRSIEKELHRKTPSEDDLRTRAESIVCSAINRAYVRIQTPVQVDISTRRVSSISLPESIGREVIEFDLEENLDWTGT